MRILLLVSPTARMRSRSTACESLRAPVTALPDGCGRNGGRVDLHHHMPLHGEYAWRAGNAGVCAPAPALPCIGIPADSRAGPGSTALPGSGRVQAARHHPAGSHDDVMQGCTCAGNGGKQEPHARGIARASTDPPLRTQRLREVRWRVAAHCWAAGSRADFGPPCDMMQRCTHAGIRRKQKSHGHHSAGTSYESHSQILMLRILRWRAAPRRGCGTDLASPLVHYGRCGAIIFWGVSQSRVLPLVAVWPSGSAACVRYSFGCCISRTRSATAVLSPDSESPGARALRHRTGLGPRAEWRGPTRDTAGGPPRGDDHASWPGGGGRHGRRRRPAGPPRRAPGPSPARPRPLLPHTLAQAGSTGQLMSWPRVHMPLRINRFLRWSRSRQRGWRRPPRGAAREAATVGEEADKRKDAGERTRRTAGGVCAATTWRSTAWQGTRQGADGGERERRRARSAARAAHSPCAPRAPCVQSIRIRCTVVSTLHVCGGRALCIHGVAGGRIPARTCPFKRGARVGTRVGCPARDSYAHRSASSLDAFFDLFRAFFEDAWVRRSSPCAWLGFPIKTRGHSPHFGQGFRVQAASDFQGERGALLLRCVSSCRGVFLMRMAVRLRGGVEKSLGKRMHVHSCNGTVWHSRPATRTALLGRSLRLCFTLHQIRLYTHIQRDIHTHTLLSPTSQLDRL